MDPMEEYNRRVTEEVERRRNRLPREDLTYEQLTKLSVGELEKMERALWMQSHALHDELAKCPNIQDRKRIFRQLSKVRALAGTILSDILPKKEARLQKEREEMLEENVRNAVERKWRESNERAGLPVIPDESPANEPQESSSLPDPQQAETGETTSTGHFNLNILPGESSIPVIPDEIPTD
jgi:hypothetical protein